MCGDIGRISNWIRTRWEPKEERIYPLIYSKLQEMAEGKQSGPTNMQDKERAAIEGVDDADSPPPDTTKTEVLTGQIDLDEGKSELDRSAPKIITTDREYSWEELGEKLLEYEGWRFRIEIS